MDRLRTYIEVHVTGTTVTYKLYGALTAGMVGVPVAFSFDELWNDLNRIAVFKGCTTKTRALVEGNDTTVPYEVLQSSGFALEIGVEGRTDDGTIVYPSVMKWVGTIQEGADASADHGTEPSPTIYDDIMAEINRIHQEGVKLAEAEIDRIVGEYLTKNPPEPGYSPSVSAQEIEGGYRITIQNKDSSQSFDIFHGVKGDKGDRGEPGRDGNDGVSIASVAPVITSTGDGGVNLIVVELSNGETSQFEVRNGSKGSPGYTPQKGIDYNTPDEKAEMVAAVLAALPAAEGVAF